MCGIAGIVGGGAPDERQVAILEEMSRRLAHRGPDGYGLETRPRDAILAHRRLAVIDIEGGQQPMSNADGSVWITYNGEIYNYRELRDLLKAEGAIFRTQSDTEVILAVYERYGTEGFRRLEGMFAFALWDERRRVAFLLRDAFGIKPLFHSFHSPVLLFASEAKALLAHPLVSRETDSQAVHDLFNLRFVPAPATLWRDIKKLEPGHLLSWHDGVIRTTPHLVRPGASFANGSVRRSGDEVNLAASVIAAVTRQTVSDVEVGAYLSGGLDSSLIVAALTATLSKKPPTFTLGFGDSHDETALAAETAQWYGTHHHATTLEPEALVSDYRRALWHMEEPRVNILQSYRLAEFASRHVKVVLSGLGGDEIFGGYHTHRLFSLLPPVHLLPTPLRATLTAMGVGVREWSSAFGPASDLPFRSVEALLSGGHPYRVWGILRNVWDHNPGMRKAVYGGTSPAGLLPASRHFQPLFAGRSPLEAVFDAEIRLKLADDFLAVEDRMSMAHGIESRVPYLDGTLVEAAARIPVHRHVMLGLGKVAFGRSLRKERSLPDFILSRKKWGFSFDPIAQYERSIRPYVAGVLTDENLERVRPLSPDYVRVLRDMPTGKSLRWHRFFVWMAAAWVQWQELFVDGEGKCMTT